MKKEEKSWAHEQINFWRQKNLFRVKIDGDDETVQTENLSKNEDEDHADEESGLLSSSSHASVADNADGVSGS